MHLCPPPQPPTWEQDLGFHLRARLLKGGHGVRGAAFVPVYSELLPWATSQEKPCFWSPGMGNHCFIS